MNHIIHLSVLGLVHMGANINISDFLIIFFVSNAVDIQKQRKQNENKKKGRKRKRKQNQNKI